MSPPPVPPEVAQLAEKGLLARADLEEVHALTQQVGAATVDAVSAALELEPLRPR